MVSPPKPIKYQDGSVLVIALLLLVILTILGVASMSGTLMQERMAGNVNLQTLAFKAASGGVATSADFADPATWPSGRECLRAGTGVWQEPFGDFIEFEAPGRPAGTTVAYRQKFGCFEPDAPLAWWDDYDVVPLQLLVLNQGVVCGVPDVSDCNEKDLLAAREIEVRVDRFGGDADCMVEVGAIDVAGCGTGKGGGSCAIQMPASGSGDTRIDAREYNGCPIRTSDPDAAAVMLARLTLGSDRTGYYQPQPAIRTGSKPFWETATEIALAVNALKIGVLGYQTVGTGVFSNCAGQVVAGDVTDCPSGDITYIAGNLTVGGGCRLQGNVFVEGEITFNGDVGYDGDVVGLGGHLDINGMGGAVSTGLLRLVNLRDRSPFPDEKPAYINDVRLEPSTKFNISGMGKAKVESTSCPTVQARWERLNTCLDQVQNLEDNEFFVSEDGEGLEAPGLGDVRFPIPSCAGEQFGGARSGIASWREYLDRERWNPPVPN